MSSGTVETFQRPKYMIVGYGLAIALAFIAAMFAYTTGKMFFGLLWLIFSLVWVKQFLWARKAPFLEVTDDALVTHIRPGRQYPTAFADVATLDVDPKFVQLNLEDGSHLRFKASDLRADDLPRLARALRARLDA